MHQHLIYSRENGMPELHHLLYPRFPAFVQAAGLLGSIGFPNIYNVTILYYKVSQDTGKKDFQSYAAPKLRDFAFGKLSQDTWHIDVNIEKISLLSLGMSRRNLEKWLEKTWFHKDNIIANKISQECEQDEVLRPEVEAVKENRRIFHRKRR